MDRDREQETRNKALVLEAFDALFNRRDFEAAERYWSPHYIQHSAVIEAGRDGLFALVRAVHRRYETTLRIPMAGGSRALCELTLFELDHRNRVADFSITLTRISDGRGSGYA